MIHDGKLGDIYYDKIWWRCRRVGAGLWQRGDWFLTREQSGGGPLIDLGVHMLDRTLDLIGFPPALSVSGTCFYGLGREKGVEPLSPTAEQALQIQLIIEALYESAERGHEVKIA
jgi:predicted dehydrogenase